MKVEHGIKSSYVTNLGWGLFEAVREFLQNGADEHTDGHKLTVTYNKNKGVLIIHNEGAVLDRNTLLLGGGKKAGTSKIGEFGEGYKLAMLVLVNSGRSVEIRTPPGERWKPSVEWSEQFQDNTLMTDVRQLRIKDISGVTVTIEGIDEESWEAIVPKFLWLVRAKERGTTITYRYGAVKCDGITVPNGQILLDPMYEGALYVQGIFIQQMSGHWRYGYNFMRLRVNRDRSIPDAWRVEEAVWRALGAAASGKHIEDLMELVTSSTKEGQLLCSTWMGKNAVHNEVTAEFKALHGDNATPCSTMDEVEVARQHGLAPVLVSGAVQDIVERGRGQTLADLVAVRKVAVTETFTMDQLVREERINLGWAVGLVCRAEPPAVTMSVRVVTFGGPTLGTNKGDQIQLARTILVDRAELIATLVHEVAHKYGTDGSVAHRAACERIFSTIIVGA